MTEAVGLPPAAVEGIEQWPVWPQLASVAPTIAYDARFMEGLMFGDPLPRDLGGCHRADAGDGGRGERRVPAHRGVRAHRAPR